MLLVIVLIERSAALMILNCLITCNLGLLFFERFFEGNTCATKGADVFSLDTVDELVFEKLQEVVADLFSAIDFGILN